MTIRQDSSSIISIQSHRGVDSSTSILKTPEGNCREMENCDISTAGIIRKRGGYVNHGGMLPALFTGVTTDTSYSKPPSHLYYKETIAKHDHTHVGQTRKLYNWATLLPLLRQEYNIDSSTYNTSFLSSGYFFGYQLLPTDDPVTMNHLFPSSLHVEGKYYEIAPVKIIGRYVIVSYQHCIVWRDSGVLPSNWTKDTTDVDIGVFPTAIGYVFPMFDSTKITRVTEISKTSTNVKLKFYAVDLIPAESTVLLHGVGLGVVEGIDRTEGSFTINVGSSGVFTQLYVSHLGTPTGTELNFASYSRDYHIRYMVVPGGFRGVFGGQWLSQAFGILYGDNYAYFEPTHLPQTRSGNWLYGYGISSGDIQTIEAYYNTDTGKNELVCVQNGSLFRLDDSKPRQQLIEGKYSPITVSTTYPASLLTTVVVDKVGGEYLLDLPYDPMKVLDYEVGDLLTYEIRDSEGGITSRYTFIVASITDVLNPDPDNPYLIGYRLHLTTDEFSDSITFFAGSTLNYTRYTKKVAVYDRYYPNGKIHQFITYCNVGDVVFFGGYGPEYSSHEVLSVEGRYGTNDISDLIFESPVTVSGGQILYLGPRWELVPWGSERYIDHSASSKTSTVAATYGLEASPYSSEVISSSRFNSAAWMTSPSDGIIRFNGKDSHSLVLLRPEIESIRSIPGSVGRIKLRSDPLEFIFVFSARDSMNNIIESETSIYDQKNTSGIVFQPNEAKTSTGTGLGEVIEFRISPPVVLSRNLSNLTLDVYIKGYSNTTPMVLAEFSKYRSVPVVTGVPVVVRVGDRDIDTSVATAERVYSLVEKNNQPSMYSKFLTSVGNRLVAMNCRTYEYIKILNKKRFRDTDSTFGAYFQLTVPMMDTISGYGTPPTLPGPTDCVVIGGGLLNPGFVKTKNHDSFWVVSFSNNLNGGYSFPNELTEETKYYYDPSAKKVYTTLANALSGTYISLTPIGSHALMYYWGVEFPSATFTVGSDGLGNYLTPSWTTSYTALDDGLQITFTGSNLGTGIYAGTVYYARFTATNVLRLSKSAAESAAGIYLPFNGSGSGCTIERTTGDGYTSKQTLFAKPLGWGYYNFNQSNVTTASNRLVFPAAHKLTVGQRVTFIGPTFPSGSGTPLVAGVEYFAVPYDATQIQLTLKYEDAITRTSILNMTGTGICLPSKARFPETASPTSSPVTYPTLTATKTPFIQSTLISAFTPAYSATPANRLEVVYTDASIFFTMNDTTGGASKVWKFRAVENATLPSSADVFLRNTFPTSSFTASASTLKLPTSWTDSALTSAGTPTYLDKIPLVAFEKTSEFSLQQVKNGAVKLNVASNTSSDPKQAAVDIQYKTELALLTKDEIIVIQGAGTLGNITYAGDSAIKSFDSDLVFKVGAADTTNITGYTKHLLIPVTIKSDLTTNDTSISLSTTNVVATSTDNYPVPLAIFKMQSTSHATRTFTGMSTQSTSLTVRIPTAEASVLKTIFVGHYVTFVLSPEDKLRIPAGVPDFSKGSFRVLSIALDSGGYDSITIQVPPSKDVYTAGTSTIKLGGLSYCVCLNCLIESSQGGFWMRLGTPAGYDDPDTYLSYTGYSIQAFVLFRGMEYGSINFQLSGWYTINAPYKVDGEGHRYAYFSNGASTQAKIDYSAITGIECASIIVSNTGWPIPMPMNSGHAESLTDLALPLFSRDSVLTNNAITQVGRRIVSCINSTPLGNFMTGTVSSMWNGLVPLDASEIMIMLRNRDVDKYPVPLFPVFEDVDFSFIGASGGADSTNTFFAVTRYSSATGKVDTIDITTSTKDVGSFFADNHPNTIVWTNDPTIQSNLSKRVPAFKQSYIYPLNTEDDSEILGGAAFQNTLIVSKKNSLWRLTFGDGADVSVQRIQSNVGSYSHNNMPATSDEMYLLHPTGVYSTDGTSVVPIFKLNQLFQDNVNKSEYLLSRTAGYVDPQQKNLYLGTPYISQYISPVSAVDGQFNYSFNDGVLGWNVNVGFDALKWAVRDGQYYFASTRGRVFRMRSEKYLTKFRDGESPIGMALTTRFLTIGSNQDGTDAQKFKFWRNVMFQFAGTSNFTFNTYYSTNYDTTKTPMETYPISGQVLEAGAKWYGNQKLLRTLRETVAQRVQSISFTLTEGSIDTDAPIYSVAVEGFQTNTRLINQKSTPGSRT